MASSSSMPPPKKDQDLSNWSELPSDLMTLIMFRLEAFEILENVQKVCKSWRRVSRDPSLWLKIDMRSRSTADGYYIGCMCRQAVDRSQGGLVEIYIGDFGCNSLLAFIAHRSNNLRSLGIGMEFPMTNNGLVNAVAKLPSLEELEVSIAWSKLKLEAIGNSCPKLKILKLNCSGYRRSMYHRVDDDAFEIAESMPELRHLMLIGSTLTDTGLITILDKCPHLEHLDVRKCSNINFFGDLWKRCLERFKEFKRPYDSTVDCPFHAILSDTDSEEE